MSKTVLITGATGLVATELTARLLSNTGYNIILVSRSPQKIKERPYWDAQRMKSVTLPELIHVENVTHADVCINTAFARSSVGKEIAESLDYLRYLCHWVRTSGLTRFINISSQSIYGNDYTPGIKESGDPAPGYMYALGKYASELICQEILANTPIEISNVRLSSVCENARFLKVFVQNALENRPISVTAPYQTVSFIDVRDVAAGLEAMIRSNHPVKGTYNLGSGKWYTISEIAELVKHTGENIYGIKNVHIKTQDNSTGTSIGMDISKFSREFDFTPQFSIKKMIESLFEMLTNINGGGIQSHLN